MSHTPGPWHEVDCRHQKRGQIRIFGPTGGHIANVLAAHPYCAKNAALIAAAPELLEALKALLPEGWGDDETMDHMPGVKLARAAIAKAEGRML